MTNNKSKKKILIIEDDSFISEMYARKLKGVGYQVEMADNGREGLELIGQQQPDLILLDLVLPEIDGFEILEKMKQDKKFKDIPVLILSNLGQKRDVEKGLNLGARDYVIKAHFTPSEVIAKIEMLLRK